MKGVKGEFVARKTKSKFITLRSWSQTDREDAMVMLDPKAITAVAFFGDNRTRIHIVGGYVDVHGNVLDVAKELEIG